MRTVGVKVLKNKLSEYLRVAESGETVLISDRDRVVAELHPPSATRAPEVADAVLADLVRRGIVQPALVGPGASPPRGRPVAKLAQLLKELDEDRQDR